MTQKSLEERLATIEANIHALPCSSQYELLSEKMQDLKETEARHHKELREQLTELSKAVSGNGLKGAVRDNTEFRKRYEKLEDEGKIFEQIKDNTLHRIQEQNRTDWWRKIIRGAIATWLMIMILGLLSAIVNAEKIIRLWHYINQLPK